jgi:hypothetical protein
VIAILLFSGFLAAAWPVITSFGGTSSAALTFEPETITIANPISGEVIEIPSFLAFAVLAFLVFGAVVVVGLIFTVLIMPLSKQVIKVNNSEKYQEENASLQQRENEKLSKIQEDRPAATSQQRDYSRWAVVATSLAILMFAVFIGLLVAASLFPSGQITEQDQIINIAAIITGFFVLVTLFILLLRMNPKRLASVDETDSEGIPWDSIVIILLGVLVLGLGIGLVIFLNRPL